MPSLVFNKRVCKRELERRSEIEKRRKRTRTRIDKKRQEKYGLRIR